MNVYFLFFFPRSNFRVVNLCRMFNVATFQIRKLDADGTLTSRFSVFSVVLPYVQGKTDKKKEKKEVILNFPPQHSFVFFFK